MDVRIVARRENILKVLSDFNAKNAMIFGSQARNDENTESDLDLLVEFDEPNLLKRIELKQELENLLGIKVDVYSRANFRHEILSQIMQEAIPL